MIHVQDEQSGKMEKVASSLTIRDFLVRVGIQPSEAKNQKKNFPFQFFRR